MKRYAIGIQFIYCPPPVQFSSVDQMVYSAAVVVAVDMNYYPTFLFHSERER